MTIDEIKTLLTQAATYQALRYNPDYVSVRDDLTRRLAGVQVQLGKAMPAGKRIDVQFTQWIRSENRLDTLDEMASMLYEMQEGNEQ